MGTDRVDHIDQEPRVPLMTLRVYRISPDGAVTEERAKAEIMPGDHLPPMMSHVYPPCACPRCRRNDPSSRPVSRE